MKKVVIPAAEYLNEKTLEFIYVKEHTLQLEHSLLSLSKWESKWKKPYLSSDKTIEEVLDYVRCMTITQNVDPNVYNYIPPNILNEITDYINESQTATIIYKNENDGKVRHGKPKQRIVTAELIYYWMFSYGIPIECQKWHLSRLLTLLEVFSVENSKSSNKMSSKELAKQNRAIIEARRKAHNSKG